MHTNSPGPRRQIVRKSQTGEPTKNVGEFGSDPRDVPGTTTLATAPDATEFTSAFRGLLDMDPSEFARLESMTSAQIADLSEVLPANTPDIPGPINTDNNAIAMDLLVNNANFTSDDEVDWTGCTGSWGTRAPGEGAVRFEVVHSHWNEGRDEEEILGTHRGTMTWDEFTNGEPSSANVDNWPDVNEGELAMWTLDVDFKALAHEINEYEGLGDETYLQALEGVAKRRQTERFTEELTDAVKEYGFRVDRIGERALQAMAKNAMLDKPLSPDHAAFKAEMILRARTGGLVPGSKAWTKEGVELEEAIDLFTPVIASRLERGPAPRVGTLDD